MANETPKIKIPLKKLTRNQALFNEGDSGNELYVIKSGSFSIRKVQNGREIEITNLQQGSIVGEMALLEDGFRSASVIATEDSSVSVISKESYQNILNIIPSWLRAIVKIISHRIKALDSELNLPLVKDPLLSLSLFLFRKNRSILKSNEGQLVSSELRMEFSFLTRLSPTIFDETLKALIEIGVVSELSDESNILHINVLDDDLLRLLIDSKSSILLKKIYPPFEYERSTRNLVTTLFDHHSKTKLPEKADRAWWENFLSQFHQDFNVMQLHKLAKDGVFKIKQNEIFFFPNTLKQINLALEKKALILEFK